MQPLRLLEVSCAVPGMPGQQPPPPSVHNTQQPYELTLRAILHVLLCIHAYALMYSVPQHLELTSHDCICAGVPACPLMSLPMHALSVGDWVCVTRYTLRG
jgi:hypothetical protein